MKTDGDFLAKIAIDIRACLDSSKPDLSANPKEVEGKRAKLLVAFSGGQDSTALLIALSILSGTHGWSIQAAHINHGLRGPESDADQAFSQSLCDELGIKLDIHEVCSLPTVADLCSEDALREMRYAFLEDLAIKHEVTALLTAHTLDDQVETILFRLIRGTSSFGFQGIQRERRLHSGILLLRPMLRVTRHDVIRFLAAQKMKPRFDSSNLDIKYSRNFIRQTILGPIKDRFPGVLERIQRFSADVQVDDEFISSIAAETCAKLELDNDLWDCGQLGHLPRPVLSRIVAKNIQERGIELTHERVELLCGLISSACSEERSSSRFSLNDTWDVKKRANHLWWLNKSIASDQPIPFNVKLRIPGSTLLATLGKVFHVECFDVDYPVVFPLSGQIEALVDLTETDKPIFVRRRLAGDFIQPLGMNERVSLKKYLHTHKAASLEPILRQSLDAKWTQTKCIVLANENEVLWIPGVGLSERIRVRNQPSHKMSILPLAADFATS
jgi:tRNA(Ile)-lysidine synthase